MLNVFIAPLFKHADRADGGIRRVVEAQRRHLSKFGINVVDNPDDARIIANHGAENVQRPGIPSISHNHGLMWSRYDWPDWAHEINENVVNAMSCAVAHTAPSEWVATSLRRGMLIYPEVIYHGVDAQDWLPAETPGRYVLWNKARQDLVSDPHDMFRVARMMPNIPFVSTIGASDRNIKSIGVVPYDEMKAIIEGAGVYLATARETFGIGTLEALAAGVPVAGWDWGGQSEIIKHGETGYLATPGNYQELQECINMCLKERERLGQNARQDAIERWRWEPRIAQYAALYKKINAEYSKQRPKVSVIVTCHNLGKYLDDCLDSVHNQSLDDWECMIVNDASKDNTQEIAQKWVEKDTRFTYLPSEENIGLSAARNLGIKNSSGQYIIPLDADDMFDEHALGVLSEALDKDPCIHVAYGHLDTVSDDGSGRKRSQEKNSKGDVVREWPPKEFSWNQQMAHLNQLTYSAMFRREVFERSGGYRVRAWRAEDANLWCMISSLGFRIKKVTERSTLVYRWRNDSKTQQEIKLASETGESQADGDWTAWYPWRIAGSHREASQNWEKIKKGFLPKPNLVPFGAQGKPPQDLRFWPVHDYSYPRVSVVIPVGPGHEEFVIDALESLVAQDYPDWEAIVVNDTGKEWKEGFESPVCGAPYATVLDTRGKRNVAHARNLGASVAKGEAIMFLDSDDYLLPGALKKMVTYLEEYDGIIYSDWLKNDASKKGLELLKVWEFKCGDVLNQMRHSGSAVLIPMWVHNKIGGWDEEIGGWEDWDYLIAAQALAGACSYYLPEPLFVYRFSKGTQREKSYEQREDLLQYIRKKWQPYYDGEREMGCGCRAKSKNISAEPVSLLSSSGNFNEKKEAEVSGDTMVLLEYNGPHVGPVTFIGKETGKKYRFGTLPAHKRGYVYAVDAKRMMENTKGGKPEFIKVEVKEDKPEPTPSGLIGEGRPEFPAMELA